MTLQVSEVVESRSQEFTGGKLTAKRVFRAVDTIAGTAFRINEALRHPNFPAAGSQHPEVKTLQRVGYRATPVSGDTSYVYQLIAEYEVGFGSDPDDPGDQETVEFSGNSEGQFLDCWRDVDLTGALPAGYDVEDDGTFTFPWDSAPGSPGVRNGTSGDIGGRGIDSGGEPVSCPHVVATWTMRRRYTGYLNFESWMGLINARNSTQFWIGNVGKVVYRGFTFKEVDGNSDEFDVTHQFAYDDAYHLRQVVWRDPQSGKPNTSGAPAAYKDLGYPVHLIQPFKRTANFNALQIPGT